MRQEQSELKAHVFVCTHRREGKESCAARGSEELRASLKEWHRQQPELRGRVRINASGCLDRCASGIAVAIYPQGEMLLDVESSETEVIQSHIRSLL